MKCSICGRSLPSDTVSCPYCAGAPKKRHLRENTAPAHAAEVPPISITKILIIILAVLIALSALAATLYYTVILPRSNYQQGTEAMDRSEWYSAALIFADCKYKDSQSLYYYCAGMYRYSQEAWADAAAYFAQSEKPAPDGVYAYCLAMDAMDNGLWSEAAQLFSLTDGYSRSEEMRSVCLALAAHEEGDDLEALSLLPEDGKYDELADAFSYVSRYDTVFLENLATSLNESFAYAASCDKGSMNKSDALDSVYYAFYDIYTANSDNFVSLFSDRKLGSLAAQYIAASLRQWSITGFDGSIAEGCEQEYFALASQRRSLVNRIDKSYPLDVDREALSEFISQANVLRTFYYDYFLPLQSSVAAALENPEKQDGAYWMSIAYAEGTAPEGLNTVFSMQLEFFDNNGNLLSELVCNELSLLSGDSLLVCLSDYSNNVKSTHVHISPILVSLNGNDLFSVWSAI